MDKGSTWRCTVLRHDRSRLETVMKRASADCHQPRRPSLVTDVPGAIIARELGYFQSVVGTGNATSQLLWMAQEVNRVPVPEGDTGHMNLRRSVVPSIFAPNSVRRDACPAVQDHDERRQLRIARLISPICPRRGRSGASLGSSSIA